MDIIQEQKKAASSILQDSELLFACSGFPGRRAWCKSKHGLEWQAGCGSSVLRLGNVTWTDAIRLCQLASRHLWPLALFVPQVHT